MTSIHRFAATTRALRAVLPPVTQGRVVLLGMASVLLLSGCMLSPLFQAPALVLTGISVLMGLAACGGGAGGGGGGAAAGSTTPSFPAVVSLNLLGGNPKYGVVLAGDGGYQEHAGAALTIGPSLNSNEHGTLVIGAPNARYQYYNTCTYTTDTYNNVGRAYVVFGSDNFSTLWAGAAPFNLSGMSGAGGIVITNQNFQSNVYLGASVAIASSLNGDGIPHVLVGAPGYYYNLGAVFGVMGQSEMGNVDVTSLSVKTGLKFYNGYYNERGVNESFQYSYDLVPYNRIGQSVIAPNLNGDGFSDLVAGAPLSSQGAYCYSSVYTPSTGTYCPAGTTSFVFNPGAQILLGSSSTASNAEVYNRQPRFQGFGEGGMGTALAAGHLHSATQTADDLVIAAPYTQIYDRDSDYNYGTVYVVFGSSSWGEGTPGDQSGITGNGGSSGFLVYNSSYWAYETGLHLAVGDVNGDGIQDLIISDYFYDNCGTQTWQGRVWVVFGKEGGPGTATVDLYNLSSSEGFNIRLPTYAYVDSLAVGDVNGDGKQDILIGSTSAEVRVPFTYYNTCTHEDVNSAHQYHNGAVFVVFGSGTPTNLSTSELTGPNGFTVIGGDEAKIGAALAAGDLNGDGRDDVAIGAPIDHSYNYYAYSYAGSGGQVYVVFGVDVTKATLPAYSLVTAGEGAYLGGVTASVVIGKTPGKAHRPGLQRAAVLGTPAHVPARKESAARKAKLEKQAKLTSR